MDDYKDPADVTEDEEEKEPEDDDIPLDVIKKQVSKEGDIPHAFDIHTPNEVLEPEDDMADPRFDEDDPAINDSDEMSEDEDDEEDGGGYFGGSDFGTTDEVSGLF